MPLYSGPISDHFDGEHFYNPRDGATMHGAGSVPKWLLTRRPARWRKWIDAPPGPTPPERVNDGKIRATFVGHSTVLIQLEGLNILCDPIWSNRASPLSWIGPPRHRAPGIHFDQLPTIDLVLQSHDQYDHFDVPTPHSGVRILLSRSACARASPRKASRAILKFRKWIGGNPRTPSTKFASPPFPPGIFLVEDCAIAIELYGAAT
jgi:Beta-lactamase superfamily domain